MANLIWIDLETTGLDPQYHTPLEVALVITDARGNAITEHSCVIRTPSDRLRDMSPAVEAMHTHNGLLAELEESHAVHRYAAEAHLLNILAVHDATGLVLAGSSVHFDRAFLKVHFPNFHAALHYRNFDVSTLERFFTDLGHTLPDEFKHRPHRALPDLDRSIGIFKHYIRIMEQAHA